MNTVGGIYFPAISELTLLLWQHKKKIIYNLLYTVVLFTVACLWNFKNVKVESGMLSRVLSFDKLQWTLKGLRLCIELHDEGLSFLQTKWQVCQH